MSLLTTPIVNKHAEADGEEYSRALETQAKAETYLQVYTALLGDRRQVMSNERTLLDAHETQEKRRRQTRRAAATANDFNIDIRDVEDSTDAHPELQKLHQGLHASRKAFLKDASGKSIKSFM